SARPFHTSPSSSRAIAATLRRARTASPRDAAASTDGPTSPDTSARPGVPTETATRPPPTVSPVQASALLARALRAIGCAPPARHRDHLRPGGRPRAAKPDRGPADAGRGLAAGGAGGAAGQPPPAAPGAGLLVPGWGGNRFR